MRAQRKLARFRGAPSTVAEALQIRDELVSLNSASAAMAAGLAGKAASVNNEVVVLGPITKAAGVIQRQTALISELMSAHESSVKAAAALVGAVKLAQDGVIDVEDILDTARETLRTGSVKVSQLDALYGESAGELSSPASTSTPPDPVDPLTSVLRSARSR